VKEYGGGEENTTNNRMELRAVIEALRRTEGESDVFVVTDSEYTRQGITSWLKGWKARGWLTQNKKPVLNQDLWRELDRLLRPGVAFGYTAGHAGDPDNERCDRIAVSFARGRPVPLEDGIDKTPCAPLQSKAKPRAGAPGPVVYLSLVEGRLRKHATWTECEAEVKGVSGARFKKCRGHEEIRITCEKWGVPPESAE
jgi:ribonuclease HI